MNKCSKNGSKGISKNCKSVFMSVKKSLKPTNRYSKSGSGCVNKNWKTASRGATILPGLMS